MKELLETGKVIEGAELDYYTCIIKDSDLFDEEVYEKMKERRERGWIKAIRTLYNGELKLVYFTSGYLSLAEYMEAQDMNRNLELIAQVRAQLDEVNASDDWSAENLNLNPAYIYVDESTGSLLYMYYPLKLKGNPETKTEDIFRRSVMLSLQQRPEYSYQVETSILKLFPNQVKQYVQPPVEQQAFADPVFSQPPVVDPGLIQAANNIPQVTKTITVRPPASHEPEPQPSYVQEPPVVEPPVVQPPVVEPPVVQPPVMGTPITKEPYAEPVKPLSCETEQFGRSRELADYGDETIGETSDFAKEIFRKPAPAYPDIELVSVNPSMPVDFHITTNEFIIGKSYSMANGVIADSAVSRRHCRILALSNKYYIEDVGSTNGTFINNIKLLPRQPYELHSGDTVTIANWNLSVKFEEVE